MAQPLLEFKDVTISYGTAPAVSHISFHLMKGEILGIAGESGSGKSSLIRAAMGLLEEGGAVESGEILFAGQSLLALPPGRMRALCGSEMAMVFQDCRESFCPVRRIGDQLCEGMRAHRHVSRRECRLQAARLLESLGLPDGERILESYPFELSGGMNQRVGVAAACLLKPSLLFADEPVSALDAVTRKKVVEELFLLRAREHTAQVLVSHDLAFLRALSDRILILKEGVLREEGSTAQIFESAKDPYTRELLFAAGIQMRKADG